MIFEANFTDNSEKKYFLVTTAAPANTEYDCHVCEAITGVFEFVRESSGWVLHASNRQFFDDGDFGRSPDAQLLQLGPDHYGLKFTVTHMATGGDGESRMIVVMPVAGKFVTALGQETEDDSEGNTVETDTVEFLPGQDPEYYSVKVTARNGKGIATAVDFYDFSKTDNKYVKRSPGL
jgi:hypothetical protein